MEHQGQSDVTLEELYDAVDLSKRDLTNQITRDSNIIYGEGAFADVHRGTWNVLKHFIDPHNGSATSWIEPCPVAIKELRVFNKRHPTWYKIINKLFHEIGIWCWLSHTNIIPFYGYTIDLNGRVGLISQWCESGDLPKYLKHHPSASREDLALDVAEGIAYLHSHSPPIVHADLKGTNILINQYGIACICDFGLSTFVEDACVQTGFTTTSDLQGGSVRWMAPELFEAINPRKTFKSDMYAFGGVLLEIFSGKAPYFYLKSDSLVMRAIMNKEAPLIKEYGILEEDEVFYWHFCLCLWNPDADVRPSAQTTVNSFYASFHLKPRENQTYSRRPGITVLDGSLYELGGLTIKVLSSSDTRIMSLSPDATVHCQSVLRTETHSEICFYDLSRDSPQLFWSISVFGGYLARCAWDSTGSVVAFANVTKTKVVTLTLANVRRRSVHQQCIELSPKLDWIKTIRFLHNDYLAIGFCDSGAQAHLWIYTVSPDLTVSRIPEFGANMKLKHSFGKALLTSHGAFLKIRDNGVSFNVLELDGQTFKLGFSQDLRNPITHHHAESYFLVESDPVWYLYRDYFQDGKVGYDRPMLHKASIHRLLVHPLLPHSSLRERYSLTKLEVCLLDMVSPVHDTCKGWMVLEFPRGQLGIWHSTMSLPCAVVQVGAPQGDTAFMFRTRLMVCGNTATLTVLFLPGGEPYEYHQVKFYRFPLPNVDPDPRE